MLRGQVLSTTLVALVSVPGFLLGQTLREGDHSVALLLLPLMLGVVLLASSLMRQDGSP